MPNPFRLELRTDSVKSSYFSELLLSRVPMIRLARNEIKSIVVSQNVLASDTKPSFVPSASAAAFRSAGLSTERSGQQMPNVVLVLVESWGLATDATISSSLAQPYFQTDLLAHYQVLR
ncbi:MAG: hypothetical protein WB919_23385, partial [Candidatus Sulfotelmatobacter sp.]